MATLSQLSPENPSRQDPLRHTPPLPGRLSHTPWTQRHSEDRHRFTLVITLLALLCVCNMLDIGAVQSNIDFQNGRQCRRGGAGTFVTVFSVLGRIRADVAGDAPEAGATAAGAVASDAIEALRAENRDVRRA